MERDDLTPGDLSQLTPEELAQRRDYTALAALARHHPAAQFPPAERALRELVALSDEAEAFTWVWALVSETADSTEARWAVAANALPERVTVPDDLKDSIRAFVVDGQGSEGQHGLMGRQLLLVRLESPFRETLARELLANEDDPPTGDLEAVTLRVLGASSDVDDRVAAFEHMRVMPDTARFSALGYFTTPYKAGEQARFAALTIESIPNGLAGQEATIRRSAAELLSGFTPKTIATVLTDAAWPADSRQQVMAQGLITDLTETGGLKALLAQNLDETIAAEVFNTASAHLETSTLADIAETSHTSYSSGSLTTVRQKVLERIRQSTEDRADLVESYWRTVASAQDDTPADELATVLEPAELGLATRLTIKDTNWHHIGRAAGLAVNRSSEAFQPEAEKIATKLEQQPKQHAAFVAGLADSLTDYGVLPARFKRHFALSPEDIKALIAADNMEVAIAGAEAIKQIDDSSRAAVDVISLGVGLEEENLDTLADLVSWTDDEQYRRYLKCLESTPARLTAEVGKAVASLNGTEASRIPTTQLKLLLSAALDSGFEEPPGHEALDWMLFHNDNEVVGLAAKWIDQSGDTSEPTVLIVIQAYHETSGQVEAIATLRSELGGRLTGVALDVERPTDDRSATLRLSARAHPATARKAAFDLAGDEDRDLRAVAAEVLAATPPEANDESRLTALIEQENVRSILDSLERARRAITSSNIDEALSQLLQLLEIEDQFTGQLDPAILLPDVDWRDGFINDVDDLRIANYTPDAPRNFINVACSLADTMAEQALVARNVVNGKATTLSKADADAIRTNRPNKPDVGTLMRVQLHQQTFPWFSPLIALHSFRATHTAPRGSTKPLRLGEREYRKTLGYLEDVVKGWITAMYDTHGMS